MCSVDGQAKIMNPDKTLVGWIHTAQTFLFVYARFGEFGLRISHLIWDLKITLKSGNDLALNQIQAYQGNKAIICLLTI